MKTVLPYILILLAINAFAQVENAGMTDRNDSIELGKVNLKGYVDIYYGQHFTNDNTPATRAYAVSSASLNQVALNLAYIDVKYQNSHVRARFIPGVGTYVNTNYATEPGTLANIIEANVGLKLSSSKDIWIDAGVIGSPFTNETPFSKDQLLYTRSHSAEFSPYYLTGVRINASLTEKLNCYLYIINGWQKIADDNASKAIATQLEYRPTNKLLINWNTYYGKEIYNLAGNQGVRLFTDIYAIYNPTPKWSFTSCFYIGNQKRNDSIQLKENSNWWQANIMGQYSLSTKNSLSARLEYMEDLDGIVTGNSFKDFSYSACWNLKITNNALFRLEARNYTNNAIEPLVIGNITVWF